MVLIRSHSPSVIKPAQAMRGSPADRRRGGTPVELRQQPSFELLYFDLFFYPMKGGFISMNTAINQKANVPVVREYKIGDMAYIVKAVVKDGAKEDAATKIRRMIRNDMQQAKSHK